MNKEKIIGFGILLLFVIPLVSAAKIDAGVKGFDLFYLFVENVFGNILLSMIGLTLIFVIIGVMSRMSAVSMSFLIGTFIMVFGMGYIGALAAVPFFMFAFVYFIRGVITFVGSWL